MLLSLKHLILIATFSTHSSLFAGGHGGVGGLDQNVFSDSVNINNKFLTSGGGSTGGLGNTILTEVRTGGFPESSALYAGGSGNTGGLTEQLFTGISGGGGLGEIHGDWMQLAGGSGVIGGLLLVGGSGTTGGLTDNKLTLNHRSVGGLDAILAGGGHTGGLANKLLAGAGDIGGLEITV